MKPFITQTAAEQRSQVERWLRPCARCGHAQIDHQHAHTERTHCAIDMGGEQSEPCGCDAYEVQP